MSILPKYFNLSIWLVDRLGNASAKIKHRKTLIEKKAKIRIPASTDRVFVFKERYDSGYYRSHDFDIQWAEGRITQEELNVFLSPLKHFKCASVSREICKKGLPRVEMLTILKNREEKFNLYLSSTDSELSRRGLRLRAGCYGAWIQLEKVEPTQALPLAPAPIEPISAQPPRDQLPIDGVITATNPFAHLQQSEAQSLEQGIQSPPSPGKREEFAKNQPDHQF